MPSGAIASTTRTRTSAQDGVSAVHRDGGAGDEVGGGARQEHGDAGHVLDRPPAPGGCATEHVLVEALDLAPRTAREVGVDPARQDGVDLDVVAGPRSREGFGELDDTALARPVRG